MSQLSQIKSKFPGGTDVYAAYIAGILSAAALAYFAWKSQVPPPEE